MGQRGGAKGTLPFFGRPEGDIIIVDLFVFPNDL